MIANALPNRRQLLYKMKEEIVSNPVNGDETYLSSTETICAKYTDIPKWSTLIPIPFYTVAVCTVGASMIMPGLLPLSATACVAIGSSIIGFFSDTAYRGVRFVKARKYFNENIENIKNEFQDDLRQINPENYTLDEAIAVIRRYYTLIDTWKEPTVDPFWYLYMPDEINTTLEQYKEYYSGMLMHKAITEDIRKEYSDIYNEQTKPFLEKFGSKMRFYESRSEYRSIDLCRELEQIFEKRHKDEIEQLNYNIKRLYPLARARKEDKLKTNFEKWFDEQTIGENKE